MLIYIIKIWYQMNVKNKSVSNHHFPN